MADNTQIIPVTLYPIEWLTSTKHCARTVNPDNKLSANTAMFYGQEYNQAGWLSIFKNTRKQKIVIKTIWALIGSALDSEVSACVVCKPLGKTYNEKLAYITTEPKYTTVINKTNSVLADSLNEAISDAKTPENNYILTTDIIKNWTAITLDKPVEVKPNEYFCAGIVSYNIPIDQYINIAKDNTEQTIRKVFYTQAPKDTDGSFTWYRSGNQDDNTSWKKYQVYIVARGDCKTFEFDDSIDPTPERPKTTLYLDIPIKDISVNQGDSIEIPININIIPDSYTDTCNWDCPVETPDFSFKKINDNILKITSKTYKNTNITTIVTIKASNAITGNSVTTDINLKALPPKILSIQTSKLVLRPTEQLRLSCDTDGNPGNITYTVDKTNIAHIQNDILTLNKLLDSQTPLLTVTAKTSNGNIFKTIEIPTAHWSDDDIQHSFNTSVLYLSDSFGTNRTEIECINRSSNKLETSLSLTSGEHVKLDKASLVCGASANIIKKSDTSKDFTLKATLTVDPSVSKNYSLSTRQIPTDVDNTILYPKSLRGNNNFITLPAIAHYNNFDKKYYVYFSTYPIYIKLNAEDKPVTVTLTDSTNLNLIIGQAFNNNIVDGYHIIRPVPQVAKYSSKPEEHIEKQYKLTINDANGKVTKDFTIQYIVYDDSMLISAKDKDKTFNSTFSKVKNILGIAQTILYEYDYVQNNSIGYSNTGDLKLNNSIYVTATKELAETQLRALRCFIDDINTKSVSFINIPNSHRTQIATGKYIMADDKEFSSETWYKTQTASPFNELCIAIKNLTGPVTHRPIYTESKPIKQLDTKINQGLYL